MGQSLQANRDQLYNDIKSKNPSYTKDEFNKNFNTKIQFDDYVNFLIKKKKTSADGSIWKKITAVTKEDYYKTYGCDFSWASGLSYCDVTPPTPTPDNDELKKLSGELIGVYKSDQTSDGKFKIFDATSKTEANSKFVLGIKSYNFSYITGILTDPQKNGDELILKLSIDTSQSSVLNSITSYFSTTNLTNIKITFSKDRESFKYDIFGHNGTATKTTEKPIVTNKTDTIKTDDKKTDSKVEKPYKPHVTTLQSKTTDYNDVGNGIFNKDYPFKVGDRNKLIGDINEKIYDSRRKDVYTQELLIDLKNIGAFGEDNYENLITQDVYKYVMSLMTPKDVIKESVKKVLKEYINKKK
jgi:hypothetical protein